MDAQRAVARRMVIGLPRGGGDAAWERDFAAYPPAGVILFARDFDSLDGLRALTRRLRALARPRRIFFAIDEEGGWVSQLAGHLAVPPNALPLARGAAPGDIEWAARVTGERLRALGIDWVFAPVADVASEPDNPVIGPRAFGADPAAVARAVGEALRGYRAAGIATCLKHFPGHGATRRDSHLELPRDDAGRAALEAGALVPFRENAGASAVMTAHVLYPALDPERPATFSPAIAGTLLRDDLGFGGVCITDALEMKGATEGRTGLDAPRAALEAGCDLLLYAFHDEAVRRIRLELAKVVIAPDFARAGYDAGRERLAAFDRAHPEPTEPELARPIASLTPPDWEHRLAAILERGIVVAGALPHAKGPWRVTEPEFAHGPTLAETLRGVGIEVTAEPEFAALELIAVARRTPLPHAELESIRAAARSRPTVCVGLQNDAWLDRVPEAALRISAADATPLTRRVVAQTLAGMRAAR